MGNIDIYILSMLKTYRMLSLQKATTKVHKIICMHNDKHTYPLSRLSYMNDSE